MNSNDQEMANRIGLSVRRVQQLADDGVLHRRPNANEFEIEENARAYRIFIDRDIEEVCRRIEAEAVAVDSGLDALRAAKSPKQRAKLAREVGPRIGALDNALRLSIAMDRPAARQLLTEHTDMIMGRTIGEFLHLAHLEIRDDPA